MMKSNWNWACYKRLVREIVRYVTVVFRKKLTYLELSSCMDMTSRVYKRLVREIVGYATVLFSGRN